ncbi:MAG: ZIP family metal transporter [Candidatus Pacebacteria bacterium]|nr:ZIP family metal transporter [Candidatus Paceibacterota bacterium]
MTNLGIVLFLSLLGSVFALTGGIIFLYVKSWSLVLTRYSVSFAAGVLLTVALIGLLPEAVEMIGENAFLVVLSAFLSAYLFENFACNLHHHDHNCDQPANKSSGSTGLIIIGDTIHNFIDGVAIAAAYLTDPGLGWITTISTFLHEIPHEIGDFGILLKKGWPPKKIVIVNILSALFTLIGTFSVVFVSQNENFIGILLASAAGMFLYLGASDFLPHAHEDLSRKKALLALLAGVGIMLGTFKIIPHSHEHDSHHHQDQPEKN